MDKGNIFVLMALTKATLEITKRTEEEEKSTLREEFMRENGGKVSHMAKEFTGGKMEGSTLGISFRVRNMEKDN